MENNSRREILVYLSIVYGTTYLAFSIFKVIGVVEGALWASLLFIMVVILRFRKDN